MVSIHAIFVFAYSLVISYISNIPGSPRYIVSNIPGSPRYIVSKLFVSIVSMATRWKKTSHHQGYSNLADPRPTQDSHVLLGESQFSARKKLIRNPSNFLVKGPYWILKYIKHKQSMV